MLKNVKIITKDIGEDNFGVPYVHKEIDEFGSESYLRADGDYDIPIDLSDEDLLTITRAAHIKNITLNQFMVNALETAINNPTILKKLQKDSTRLGEAID